MVQERVGKRVRVFWRDEEEWFEGMVKEFDSSLGYYVVYDDGDERWEPIGQQMLVDGEELTQTAADNGELRDFDRGPQMMEPPVLSDSDFDQYSEEIEQGGIDQQSESEIDKANLEHRHKYLLQSDKPEDEVDADVFQQNEETAREINDEDAKDNSNPLPEGTSDDEQSDDEQSVAESEMPQTFGKTTEMRQLISKPSTRLVPSKGLLKGRVLRATGLQSNRALAPNAFVRVSFLETGNGAPASAMLRCKETLYTTNVVQRSANPVWSEDDSPTNYDGDAGFHFELPPRIASQTTSHARHQLSGDLLFTVYSVLTADGGSRNEANEHIGEATLSVRSLLQDLMTTCFFTSRVLELRSRSGKRLLHNDRVGGSTLTASFQFVPLSDQNTGLKDREATNSVSSSLAPAKSTRKLTLRQEKTRNAKQSAPAKTSSSHINRRRYEKQIAKENQFLAKRLELEKARRTRQLAQFQAQGKEAHVQCRARKHKPHAEVNRDKFVKKVAEENQSIGRRLQNILKVDEGARKHDRTFAWVAAEPKVSFDNIDREKVHAQDKRWQRQVELDYVMEKAQTQYQRQHQIVNEITTLQEAVATLKTQEDEVKKRLSRLERSNQKNQHVRDCLLRAAKKSTSTSVKAPLQQLELPWNRSPRNNKSDQEIGGNKRRKQEWELLTQHEDRLQTDKVKFSQELKALNQQELDLDDEMHRLSSQWEYAKATKLFQQQMDKKNAIEAQQAALDMRRRQKALELSNEEEDQWARYQAYQELTQLQIALQIARDHVEGGSNCFRASKFSSSASCEFLTKKIEKQKNKLQHLQDDVKRVRADFEAMLVSGRYESLRNRVQELQKLVFLCKSQATHVMKAERMTQRKGEQANLAFQRRLFCEQTETEILLKKSHK